jgi:hypothetical protein
MTEYARKRTITMDVVYDPISGESFGTLTERVKAVVTEDSRVLDVPKINYTEYDVVEKPNTPNRERLLELVAWASGEAVKEAAGLPSEWNQQDWLTRRDDVAAGGHCGTACCIGGRAAMMAGGVPCSEYGGRWDDQDDGYTGGRVLLDGVERRVSEVAQEYLGLNYDQRQALFHGSNELQDVVDVVGQILAGDKAPTSRHII